jgi:hypothetical protein
MKYINEEQLIKAQLTLPCTCAHSLLGTGKVVKVISTSDLILCCQFGSQQIGVLYSTIRDPKTASLTIPASQRKLFEKLWKLCTKIKVAPAKTTVPTETSIEETAVVIEPSEPKIDAEDPIFERAPRKNKLKKVELVEAIVVDPVVEPSTVVEADVETAPDELLTDETTLEVIELSTPVLDEPIVDEGTAN